MNTKYKLKCHSPVHIGTGTSFTRFDSVYDAPSRKWMPIDLDKVAADPHTLAREMEDRNFAWVFWLRKNNVPPAKVALYQLPCAQDPEDTEVREAIKNPYLQPYIPGSSIKGAIRTAVLWHLLKMDESHQDFLQRQLCESPSSDRRYAAQRIEQRVFGKEPNLDLMRAVQVSDSDPIRIEDMRVYLTWTYTLRNEKLVEKREGNSEFKIFAEGFKHGTEMVLTIRIDEALFGNNSSPFGRKVKEQLNFQDQQVQAIRQLAKTCNHFSNVLIAFEQEFYEDYGLEHLQGFYDYLREVQENLPNGGFLLNIGWGGGWEPKTIGVQDFIGDDDFQALRARYNLGKQNSNIFPKTRRVVYVQGVPKFPLGWVSLEPIRE